MATRNKRRGWGRWKRRSKATPAPTEVEPGQDKQPTPEPPIKKGIYLSALIYIEGEQAAPADFAATAKDALKKKLNTALEEAGDLHMTVKKIEVQNDIEEEEEEEEVKEGKRSSSSKLMLAVEGRMFTREQRDNVRERVLALARSDPRVTAGALTGSTALGTEDEWSDVDVAFGITDGITPEAVLDDWTEVLARELGALHHWDLRSGESVYRVFLLPSGLEVNIGVSPQKEFGARGSRFRTIFGTPSQVEPSPQPVAHHLVGLGWHHVLHARSCIERGKPWQAEYWVSAIRDHTLTLACLRLGEETFYARGADRLPTTLTAPLAEALVHSLEESELRRALGAATRCFISEVEALDTALCKRLKPLLQEFGEPQSSSI